MAGLPAASAGAVARRAQPRNKPQSHHTCMNACMQPGMQANPSACQASQPAPRAAAQQQASRQANPSACMTTRGRRRACPTASLATLNQFGMRSLIFLHACDSQCQRRRQPRRRQRTAAPPENARARLGWCWDGAGIGWDIRSCGRPYTESPLRDVRNIL